MTRYRVGVDVGGTFTDVVLMDERSRLSVKKILSSPHDYSEAILEALDNPLRRPGAATWGRATDAIQRKG